MVSAYLSVLSYPGTLPGRYPDSEVSQRRGLRLRGALVDPFGHHPMTCFASRGTRTTLALVILWRQVRGFEAVVLGAPGLDAELAVAEPLEDSASEILRLVARLRRVAVEVEVRVPSHVLDRVGRVEAVLVDEDLGGLKDDAAGPVEVVDERLDGRVVAVRDVGVDLVFKRQGSTSGSGSPEGLLPSGEVQVDDVDRKLLRERATCYRPSPPGSGRTARAHRSGRS